MTETPKKVIGRPFQKGQSGNPNGTPKALQEVRTLARQYGRRAIERLVELMETAKPEVAQRAADSLLDRGFGKPAQAIVGEDGGAPRFLIETHIIDHRPGEK